MEDKIIFLEAEVKRLESRIEKIKTTLGIIADVLNDFEKRLAAIEKP